MLSQASINLKNSDVDAALTIEQLQETMRAGGEEAKRLTMCMYRYGANITGSPPY